jgi:hypothetical protein
MKKIQTPTQLVDSLYEEMGWRKKELTNIYNDVFSSKEKNLPPKLRSAVVMLYAHWEGYIKATSEAYLNFVDHQGLTFSQLSMSLLAFSLKRKMNDFRVSNNAMQHLNFVDLLQNGLGNKARIPIGWIRTNANLNSDTLCQICVSIGLDTKPYELKYNMIDSQLLRYRNTVAHGNYLLLDKKEYAILYSEIMSMLNQFQTDIENQVLLGRYKKLVVAEYSGTA